MAFQGRMVISLAPTDRLQGRVVTSLAYENLSPINIWGIEDLVIFRGGRRRRRHAAEMRRRPPPPARPPCPSARAAILLYPRRLRLKFQV